MKEFLNMGGYGIFVWSSYAIAALLMIINVYLAHRKNRQINKELSNKNS